MDTEFERTRTFYAKLALIQLSDSRENYLLDPLRITDLSPLGALWVDPGITKVLHAPGEDIEILSRQFGAPPTAIFDTQLAASMAGHGHSLGYGALVEKVEGTRLPKQETRSNWLMRPLSETQLEYAALDVEYLPLLHQRLSDELEAAGRSHWLGEECSALVDKHASDPQNHDEAYLKIGQAWKLGRQQLGVLRALCAWREHEARKQDRPRAHILENAAILVLAQSMPRDKASLDRIGELGPRVRSRTRDIILGIVEKVSQLDESRLPARLDAPLDLKPFAPITKALKEVVHAIATEQGLTPELIAHRRALEGLVRHRLTGGEGLTPHFVGWRGELAGERLLETLTHRLPFASRTVDPS